MRGLSTIGLLILSNIFMTFAWYGHLKLQEAKIITHWHTVDLGTERIEQLLNYRCVGAGGGKYQLSCIQRTVFDTVCQF